MSTVIECTHRAGKPVDPANLEIPMAGTIVRKARYDAHARRQQVYMEFAPLPDPSNVLYQERLGDLLDPVPLAFDSARGMMIASFEIINGGRHYQGWWVRWHEAMPKWYDEMTTPR